MRCPKVILATSLLVVGLAAAGCGKVDLVAVDPAGATTGTTGGASPSKTPTTPVVVAPTPAPQQPYNPPLQLGKIEARVVKFDNGYIFGLFGTKTAHVEVKNSTTVPLRGKIKCQFTNDGSPMTDKPVQTKDIELEPGQTETLTFSDKGMKIDGAAVTVEMEGAGAPGAAPAQAGVQMGGGSSVYGMPPSY